MKKLILLAAVAAFSLTATSQVSGYDFGNLSGKNMLNGNIKMASKEMQEKVLANLRPAKAASRSVTENQLPADGERRTYYLSSNCYVMGLGVFQRFDKVTLVFTDDGRVYVPLMIWDDVLPDVYLEGTCAPYNETLTQISIPNNQVVGTTEVNGEQANVFVSRVTNNDTGEPSSTPMTLYIDESAGGIIYVPTEDYTIPGIYVTVGGQTYLQTMCEQMQYFPPTVTVENAQTGESETITLFGDPEKRNVKCTSMEIETVDGVDVEVPVEMNTTAESVTGTIIDGYAIKGLLPAYPDAWCLMYHYEGTSDIQAMSQYLDTRHAMHINSNSFTAWDFNRRSIFTANFDGSYTQDSGDYIYSGYSSDGIHAYVDYKYCNFEISAPVPTGINNVETSTDKEAVSVEYYDLSGRRISAAEKGVSIKVEKYADGTSKAVKVMK